MKPQSITFLLSIALHLLSLPLAAQKHFSLTVKLPPGIDKRQVEAYLEDGKGSGKIKTLLAADGQLVFKGDYYFLYAAITIQDTSIAGFSQTFFVQQKPAKITFHQSNSADSPFKEYSLQNAVDFKFERKQMDDYCAVEIKRSRDYELKYGENLFSGADTAGRYYFFNVLEQDCWKKELKYILKNRDSYYSFYTFRSRIAEHMLLQGDSLLAVFNKFPEKFKYSDEGNYLHTILYGRSLKKNDGYIDFTTSDINKRSITLSEFKGKKYVMLHFWATWCSGCMQELPAVKDISVLCRLKDVQIISIAFASPKYSTYIETIKKYQMDWIQIYDDESIYNKYGNVPIPRICLFDKNGKLIYDNRFGQGDDLKLSHLKSIIAELIN